MIWYRPIYLIYKDNASFKFVIIYIASLIGLIFLLLAHYPLSIYLVILLFVYIAFADKVANLLVKK